MTTPDEYHSLNVGRPSTSSQQLRPPIGWQWFRGLITKYLESILMTALWSASLLFGGGILILYFVSKGFMPEMDLNSSIVLLAVSALTGGFLLITVGLTIPVAGWVWVWATQGRVHWAWFAGPLLAVMLSELLPLRVWWHAFVILIIGGGSALLFRFFHKERRIGDFLQGFALSLMCSLTFMLLIYMLAQKTQDLGKHPAWLGIIAVTILVTANTCLVAEITGGRRVKRALLTYAAVIGVVAFFCLLFVTGNSTLIPSRVMSAYKWGNFTATLVLDETGCAIAQHYGSIAACDSRSMPLPTPKTGCLPNVTVLSRLGSAYYLEVSPTAAGVVRFTVPSQHVLSWAVNESKEEPGGAPPACTQNPAPTADTTRKQTH